MMTGSLGSISWMAWKASRPLIPGRRTSMITRSGTSAWTAARAASPLAAVLTVWPSSVRSFSKLCRSCGSSSTIRIVAHALVFLEGQVMIKVAPSFSLASRSSRPPWSSMMRVAMLRPRPVPSSLVLKKGWNTWSRMDSGIPGPVSLTRMTTVRPRAGSSLSSSRMVMTPPLTMTSQALTSRLARTSFSWSGSARISGSLPSRSSFTSTP